MSKSWSPSTVGTVPVLLLLLFGFVGMVGRAARVGFAPCGTGGFGLTGPPEGLEEDAALDRGAGSGLVSPRRPVFSGELGSDLLTTPGGGLLSERAVWGFAADTCRAGYSSDHSCNILHSMK